MPPQPRTLVTGGTRGIGAAVVRRLAQAGHEIVALGSASGKDRGARASPEQADAMTGSARILRCDVRDPRAVAEAVAAGDADGAGYTGLVANAGVWRPTPVEGDPATVSDAHLDVLRVNVLGVIHAATAFLARLRPGTARAGSIVLVGSTAGQRGEAGHGAYAASKAALMGLCKSWAVELAPRGVRVNVVAPGWVDTDMSASVLGDPARRAAIESSIPRGRVASAEDVAGPIAWLLGDDAAHVTGTVLSVNGGGVMASY